VAVHLHQPRARSDVRVGIQIRNIHRLIEPQMNTDEHGKLKMGKTSNNHQSALRFASARHPTPNIQ
jgi:hypothetical protein